MKEWLQAPLSPSGRAYPRLPARPASSLVHADVAAWHQVNVQFPFAGAANSPQSE